MRERKRNGAGGGGEGEREADSYPNREPDGELNPRTLGSQPEPKADASLTEPPRRPQNNFLGEFLQNKFLEVYQQTQRLYTFPFGVAFMRNGGGRLLLPLTLT